MFNNAGENSDFWLNLKPDSATNNNASAGQMIEWRVKVDAYPWPEIAWLKPNGEEIMATDKFAWTEKGDSVSLKIRADTIEDSGTYRLRAAGRDKSSPKLLNFTLRVRGGPKLHLKKKSAFVYSRTHFHFSWRIQAFPRSNVSLLFRPCPPGAGACGAAWSANWPVPTGPRRQLSQTINNETASLSPINDRCEQTLEVAGTALTSGEYWCLACNELHCTRSSDDSVAKIYVSGMGCGDDVTNPIYDNQLMMTDLVFSFRNC